MDNNDPRNGQTVPIIIGWCVVVLAVSILCSTVTSVETQAAGSSCPCGPCQGEKPLPHTDPATQKLLDRCDAHIHEQHEEGFWSSFFGWLGSFLMSTS
jgi:hypothetical protein